MSVATITDGQSLFRHAVHPVSFRGKGIFASEKLFYLKDRNGVLFGSLVWERFVPTKQHVHERGCQLAQARNDEKRAEGKYKEASRQVYCGAYHLQARTIRSIAQDQLAGVSLVDVIHSPEDGEIAHTDLRVFLTPEPFDVEGTKTAVLDRLWHASSGPLRHTCECDLDLHPHPNLKLIEAPLGPYLDRRSWVSRLWYLFRFEFLKWRRARKALDGQIVPLS
jgi:hypothetical protein